MARSGLTAGTAEVAGKVGGSVLAAIRGQVGWTQERLAEQLGVGLTTVQAWESGRRPLIHARFADLQRLHRQLHVMGASSAMLRLFDQALTVDAMYGDMHRSETEQHPLALMVPDRATTDLMAWPLGGATPRQLRGTIARLEVPLGVRDAVAAELCAAVDRSTSSTLSGAMLRRQVKFLVAGNTGSASWLQQQAAVDTRTWPDLRAWSPRWAVARSQAVSAAHEGDPEPLRRFIRTGLADDASVAANLNYWAYWVGEYSTPWGTDAEMTNADGSWSGARLLDSLLGGVVTAPYRELCVHALWSLLRQRRHLAHQPAWRSKIVQAADEALAGQRLDKDSRRRLEQVSFLAESAG